MRATALEFRLRYLLHAIIFALGFFAPWDRLLAFNGLLRPGQSTWLVLASLPARYGGLSFAASTVAVLVCGIVFAGAGAILRTWASAFPSASVLESGAMQAGQVIAAGPYRFVRNPLYLGIWLHAIALALLMPPTGAIFAVVAIAILGVRLVGGEEAYLGRSLGQSYLAYCAAVPRIVPALTPRLASTGVRGRWPQAMLGEIYVIGVALSFVVLGWRYNALLLTKCVLISLGASLVARAFLPSAAINHAPTEAPAVTTED